MSTNANIMMMNDDKSVDVIYDHWDGYLSNLGNTLEEYYYSDEKVRELINLGDVSQVGAVVDTSPVTQEFGFEPLNNRELENIIGNTISNKPGSSKDKLFNAIMFTQHYFTIAYHRDRGEDLSIAHYDDVDAVPLQEFNYLYVKNSGGTGHWLVKTDDESHFHDLKLALQTDPE